ncbi:MAG: TRAP transporter small permease [Acidobacteriia bacterium]|jgi:TRAP-type C4-dicarboxylate transport system permease small subunit|nr:TRAP transporter small permease [Methyloceanibacter sp.]MCL6491943.1 TRAP transporter small permease [Terriglobia bacterium]
MDRVINGVERFAGGLLAFVTALAFISVVLRYLFSWPIPDSYDLSRNLLGVLIFWGIAASGYRGEHVTVDLIWSTLPPGARRLMDIFATLLTLFAMAGLALALALKVQDLHASGEATYDLALPVWPFAFFTWAGSVAAVLLLAVRLLRQIGSKALPETTPSDNP